jgi:dihydrodiol dehydrogenase / D-xylose 1-dehydrogenase (NADP)
LLSDHVVVAVAARDVERAQNFAQSNKLNHCQSYGNYQDLAEDEHVEVVYVGTVTSTHFDVVKMLLEKSMFL